MSQALWADRLHEAGGCAPSAWRRGSASRRRAPEAAAASIVDTMATVCRWPKAARARPRSPGVDARGQQRPQPIMNRRRRMTSRCSLRGYVDIGEGEAGRSRSPAIRCGDQPAVQPAATLSQGSGGRRRDPGRTCPELPKPAEDATVHLRVVELRRCSRSSRSTITATHGNRAWRGYASSLTGDVDVARPLFRYADVDVRPGAITTSSSPCRKK